VRESAPTDLILAEPHSAEVIDKNPSKTKSGLISRNAPLGKVTDAPLANACDGDGSDFSLCGGNFRCLLVCARYIPASISPMTPYASVEIHLHPA
jgi:hypothetical protein